MKLYLRKLLDHVVDYLVSCQHNKERHKLSTHGAMLTELDFEEQLVEKKKQELAGQGRQQVKLRRWS